MPNLPISQLPPSDTLTGVELFADVQGGITKYTTLNNIAGFVTESIPGIGGSGLGWARYDDNQYTTSSFLTVVDGATAIALPNNGGSSVITYMNSVKPFYNGTTKKVQVENSGDVYTMVVTFQAKAPNANQTHIDISLSSIGATPYDRVSKSLGFIKGNNQWQNFFETFNFYADADFVTNGNQWKIFASGGNVDIAGAIYFIQRTFNAG
jgi:hypothetical protein